MNSKTIVTVGAGQVAAVTARTLRRRGFDGRIVLVGDEPHAPYQRPPLSKEFLAGTATADSLALFTPKWLATNDVEVCTGVRVTRIDTSSRSVELDGHPSIPADFVVIAAGGRPRQLRSTGTRPDLVHYLRTLDDATNLAGHLRPNGRLIVIGGGFIGLEIASTAVGLGVEVTLLEAANDLLAGPFGAHIGALCADMHRANGVKLRTGVGVVSIDTSDAGVRIGTTTGETVEADCVVVGIGIEPNVDVAAASGLRVDNGVVVDSVGRTAVPEIFAAGDVANRFSDRLGRQVRAEHFDSANRQSSVVANTIVGRDAIEDGPHWFWSDQYDNNIQFAGSAAGATDLVFRGTPESGEFAAFYLHGSTLAGAFAMNRGEDIMAARELIGTEIDPVALADEGIDLWNLTDEVAS